MSDTPGIDIAQVLTEGLTLQELSGFFAVERHSMKKIIEGMPGAVREGSRWRLPIQRMPAPYLLKRGFIRPVDFGVSWKASENRSGERREPA